MDYKDIIKEFSVTIYGNLTSYNQVLSKARVRTFYKKFNRNGTYITDEFAEKLIASAPYTPVKGIYDNFNDDYTDHGKTRDLGRIYGIVPENPNFAWEIHPDEDGIDREYACFDVLLFTALYEEASEIVGKSQSMELYEPTLKGEFRYIEGKKAFVFTEGCFLGLQVLGDGVEPCFEGAAFYTFYDSLKETLNKLEQFSLESHIDKGGAEMPNNNFKLSDSTKHDMLWDLLNPNYNESGNWTIDYSICDIYDEYAIAYKYETREYERIYYTKDDDKDSLTINKKKKCFIVDVTEDEKNALSTIQALNGGTYEKIDENFTKNDEVETKFSEYEQKIEERDNSISTLTTERDTAEANYTEAQTTIQNLNEELDALKEYKLNTENEEKQTIIDKYSEQLDETIIDKYTEKISEYTIADLEKDLAFELVQANPSIFTANPQGRIPKDTPKSGLEAILEKYVK